MQVECVLFGPLREAVGEKTLRVETDAPSVGELLGELERDYPALEGRLVDEDGEGLVDGLAVTIDKKHVQHVDGFDTRLSEGSTLRMTPAVYGGEEPRIPGSGARPQSSAGAADEAESNQSSGTVPSSFHPRRS